jgi:hypothetical protein
VIKSLENAGKRYIEDNADDPGVKCLRIDDNLSPAILNNLYND